MNKNLKNKKVHIFFISVIVISCIILFWGHISNWSSDIQKILAELIFVNIAFYILSIVNGYRFVLKVIVCSILMLIFFVSIGVFFERSIISYIKISVCGFLLWLGMWLFWGGIRSVKYKVYSEEEEDTKYFWSISLFIIGTMLIVINIFEIIRIIAELLKSWGYKNNLTSISVIITVITFLLGSLVKLKISNDSNKKDRTIELHKEIDWRKELHDLEIKSTYNIKDLLKINSFFNPKHDIRDKDDIDVRLNKAIVDIVVLYVKPSQVSSNKNNKNIHEPILTLFNIRLTKQDLSKELSSKETQIIREYIHELLKNDWKIQTKY